MANLLTFTYLRDLQKKERESRKLEKLNSDFYQALSDFISRKNGDAAGKKEFESAVPVIRYILDRREQKVLEAAMLSVRAGIRPENLLPEEESLFTASCAILAGHKARIDEIFGIRKEESQESVAPKLEGAAAVSNGPQETTPPAQPEEKKPEEVPVGLVKIKVLKEVPAFIAEDLVTHGPWVKDVEVECPPKAAAILVENGFAEYN